MNKNIKYIIENTNNFNVIDYNDEDDIIDNQTIKNVLSHPQTQQSRRTISIRY